MRRVTGSEVAGSVLLLWAKHPITIEPSSPTGGFYTYEWSCDWPKAQVAEFLRDIANQIELEP
jgi:hypothetical protein